MTYLETQRRITGKALLAQSREAARLDKGTKVKYRQHTRMARGGGVCARETWGTITGTYGDLYVITSRWGGRKTREAASDVLTVLDEWPNP